jgi:dihydroorotase
MELYAQAFDEVDALDKLEAFASFHGPAFYGLPRNQDTLHLSRTSWTLPEDLPLGDVRVVPLNAGEVLHWKIT